MSKQQLFKRVKPEVIARTIREWNDSKITVENAASVLQVSRPQLYRLRTKWLSSGKGLMAPNCSGGDHSEHWPAECVEHLEKMILSSGEHGPNYALYADELARKFDFRRDRSNVRKYCEVHLKDLLSREFAIVKKRKQRMRRWAKDCFGELVQHDSTPLHLWGTKDARQAIIITKDDATRSVLSCRICERETVIQHFAAMEQMMRVYGTPKAYYTDAFSMFGKEGIDLKSQFGRACCAFGILHQVAPTPEAKGKIERDMRTFQHRLAVVFATEGVTNEEDANKVAYEHCLYWNEHHVHEELGCTPLFAQRKCEEEGRSLMGAAPSEIRMKLFLSMREKRNVELGRRIEFNGKKWSIASTLKKSVVLAIRPLSKEFYVLEEDLDPTINDMPRILARYSF